MKNKEKSKFQASGFFFRKNIPLSYIHPYFRSMYKYNILQIKRLWHLLSDNIFTQYNS